MVPSQGGMAVAQHTALSFHKGRETLWKAVFAGNWGRDAAAPSGAVGFPASGSPPRQAGRRCREETGLREDG